MHVTSVTEAEIRLTLEAMVDLANGLTDGTVDVRALLSEAGFSRASAASEASMRRVERRMTSLLPFLSELPDLAGVEAAAKVNAELTEIAITPSIVEHDGVGQHIHWTPATAKFDDQVIADTLMAMAQEICDNGTERFGRCAADDCEHLFYDATRNRSRRFCADPRCASRTHTADHRARRRNS